MDLNNLQNTIETFPQSFDIVLGPESILWSLALVFMSTTSSTSSPAGLLFSTIVVTRPQFFTEWWISLSSSSSPLVFLGVKIPLLVLLVYWLHGLLLLALDFLPQLSVQYKIQPTIHLDTSRLPHLFKTLAKVQLLVFLPLCFALAFLSVHSSWGLYLSPSLPSARTLVFHIIGYALVDEVLFYWMHRLAHHRLFYRHVHKVHHEWTAPIALATDYCHPLEHALVNVLPNIAYAIIIGSDPFSYLYWWIISYIASQTNHSGYRLPSADLTGESQPNFHDLHHQKFTCNYGSTGHLDWLLGTLYQPKSL